ncbi:MAG: SAM-dependent methyltransferase [Ginsengibacter sp.]
MYSITMSLAQIIIQKIQNDGPNSFHDFMELALYYPEYGYYTSSKEKIGKHGDFYTTPYLTSIFGYMIAKQLEEMWHILDKKPFTIVEYGAGSGFLCNDILNRLKINNDLYDELNYYIIEKSEAMRQKEKMFLHQKVQWVNCIRDVPLNVGCVLSNEVVDNFPVHRVVMENELMEVFVDYNNGFVEILNLASETLENYLNELQIILPKGFRTEVNLHVTEWIKEIVDTLKAGFVLTIDYGHPSSILYNNQKSRGTLVCYHKQSINYCPYANIGEQDITDMLISRRCIPQV